MLAIAASPALAAESPWHGWQPQSIASPAAKTRFLTEPVTGTTLSGSPVVAWTDQDGAVEASVRDDAGHWVTSIIGNSPVERTLRSKGWQLRGTAPFLTRAPDGAIVVGWAVCAPPAASCQTVPPLAWAASRLEADGSWSPVSGATPVEPLLPPPLRGDPAFPFIMNSASNERGDGVAVGIGHDFGSIVVTRSVAQGAWSPPAALALPRGCQSPAGFELNYYRPPAIDAGGSGAEVTSCWFPPESGPGGQSGERLHDGPPIVILLPAGGDASASQLPVPPSRHITFQAAAFASGGLIVEGDDSRVHIYDWSHAGQLGELAASYPCAGSWIYGCYARVTTAPDGRAVVAFGAPLAGSDNVAIRAASGAWTPAYPLPMRADMVQITGGVPGFLALADVRRSPGSKTGGFSIIALGTDASAPSGEKRPYLRRADVRVGVRLHLASRGTWRGAPLPALRVRWLRCRAACTVIRGATARAYRLKRADLGWRIAAEVTASNASGRARDRVFTKPVRW